MDELLKSVRDVLVADGTLTALVAAADIRIMFEETDINYPSVGIWYGQGQSPAELSGVTRGALQLTIWSQANVLALFGIHNRIHTLLHNQEQNLSGSGLKVHSMRFTGGVNWNYAQAHRAWRMVASYNVLAEDV